MAPPRVEQIKPIQDFFRPKPIEPPKSEAKPLEVKTLSEADKNLFLRQTNIYGDTLKLNLFAQFNQTNSVTAKAVNPDPKKVEDAVKAVKDSLSQGVFDWDVSHGDLKDIQKTFQNLTPEEANEVFKNLSDSDLKDWADELDGTAGSFDKSEKKQLFDELAGKLDGQQLARMINALGDEGNIQSISDSVANNASDATKVDLINRMKDYVEKNPGSAKGVAELITGLGNNPTALEGVLQNLSLSQLQAVMKAASQEEIHTTVGLDGSSSIYTTFDPQPLADMLNAVAKTGNAELKAKVFEAGASELKRIEEAGGLLNPVAGQGDAAKLVRDGLTSILDSDTTGIVTKLENENKGESLKNYVKSMLATGNKADQEKLGEQISKLLSGNNIDQNPVTRFEQTSSGTLGTNYYQNARNLGFYAGAIHAGIKSITDDRGDQAAIIKNVFEAAAGIVGAEFPITGAVAHGINMTIIDEVVKNLDNQSYDLRNAMIELTFPHDRNGNLYRGPAKTEYESAFAATALKNDN